jgi:hypothetical protein
MLGAVIGLMLIAAVVIAISRSSSATLVPTAIAIAPIAAPSATSAAAATSVPTVIAATNTPVASASSATSKALPTATMPPTSPAMPKPTASQLTIPSDKILFREDFNDPQFDGGLPPNVRLIEDWCSNMKVVQEKGSLTFQAPANIKPGCGVSFGFPYNLSQIKAVEFALSSSPETPVNHPSFAPMLAGGSDNGQESIMLICGLGMMGNQYGCVVKKDQQDIYRTETFIEKPGDSYTFRIEVLDPDKMTFRFLSNGDTIGEFTLPPADVPVYKDVNCRLNGGLVGMNNTTKAGLYFIDYLAIEQR